MYFELDKIDVLATAPDRPRQLLIHTDHRSPDEIREEGALAHLFALGKIARSGIGKKQPAQIYVCQELPPDDFRQTLDAIGAELHLGEAGRPIPWRGKSLDYDPLVDGKMAELGASTGVRDLAELATFEAVLADELHQAGRALADLPGAVQLPYWRSVLELSAAAGEVLRRSVRGGHWVIACRPGCTLPFTFVHDHFAGPQKVALFFICDRAARFYANGRAFSVAAEVERALDEQPPPPPRRGLWNALFRR
jgi:hypothetical protein